MARIKQTDNSHGQFITVKWDQKYHPKNEISKIFRTKTISEYTNKKYKDGIIGHVLIFENDEIRIVKIIFLDYNSYNEKKDD
jgi:hypothetical protein